MTVEIDRWDVEVWAAKSRKGEVCGIFGCPDKPVEKCPHCGNWYCDEHKEVIKLPGHQGSVLMEEGESIMEVEVTIKSEALSKEDVRCLVQSIRDCEMKYFPSKEISVWVKVPELTTAECTEILTSIRPPYKYGPSIHQIRFGG